VVSGEKKEKMIERKNMRSHWFSKGDFKGAVNVYIYKLHIFVPTR
jgi:hypothetical protein